MDRKKEGTSEENAKALVVLSLGLAIMLFIIDSDRRRNPADGWHGAGKVRAAENLRPCPELPGEAPVGERVGKHPVPAYPWKGAEELADIKAASEVEGGEVPEERSISGEKAKELLGKEISIPAGAITVGELKDVIESETGVNFYTDRGVWTKWINLESDQKKTSLEMVVSILLKTPGTDVIFMKDHKGVPSIFVIKRGGEEELHPM